MGSRIRIGLLGGSFNPPHAGHLHISTEAIKKLGLTQLWWVVSPQNPLKKPDISSSLEKRMKLCKELTSNNPQIKITDLEKEFFPHAKYFYTYDLLKRLKQKYPAYDFYFIIGADNLISFHRWYKFKEIVRFANLVVFNRPGYKRKALTSKAAQLLPFIFLDEKMVNISSTELR